MKKNSILVEHLLNHTNAIIFQETNTFISFGISSPAGSTIYYLQQTFGKDENKKNYYRRLQPRMEISRIHESGKDDCNY